MATMNQVIAQLDRVKPNVFTDDDKYRWISTLEGLVAREVMGEDTPELNLPADADKELSVPYPYDDLYLLYAGAQAELYSREYEDYNSMAVMFEQRYDQFKAWYIQRHAAGKALNFRNVMG